MLRSVRLLPAVAFLLLLPSPVPLISCWCASRLLAARALLRVAAFHPASSLELLCPRFWSFRFGAASGAASAAFRPVRCFSCLGSFLCTFGCGRFHGAAPSQNFIWKSFCVWVAFLLLPAPLFVHVLLMHVRPSGPNSFVACRLGKFCVRAAFHFHLLSLPVRFSRLYVSVARICCAERRLVAFRRRQFQQGRPVTV